MTHNNELLEKSEASLLKHKKTITAVSVVFALIFIGAMGYEIFSPHGFDTYRLTKNLELLPRALLGDPEYQHELALTYKSLYEPDHKPDKKRFYWYRKAAEGGDPYGSYVIARYYERGYGVAQNRRKAIEWYGIAAVRDDRWSQKRLSLRAISLEQDSLLIAAGAEDFVARQVVALEGRNLGTAFRECPECPEMVVIPGIGRNQSFGLSKFEITVADYAACLRENFCWYGRADRTFPYNVNEMGHSLPMVGLNFSETQDYLKWLYRKTGHIYRLPTQREWLWAARGGAETQSSPEIIRQSVCRDGKLVPTELTQEKSEPPLCDEGVHILSAVGRTGPNGFGLYGMAGKLNEIATDCRDIGCDPKFVVGGNVLAVGPKNKSAQADYWAMQLGTETLTKSVLGLRVVRDFEKSDQSWFDVEIEIASSERMARENYYLENATELDALLFFREALEMLDEYGYEFGGFAKPSGEDK